MDLKLKEKVALVTAASRGLGYAVALALAQEGAKLAICSRGQAAVDAAAERLRQATGCEVQALPADLTKAEDIERLTSETLAHYGHIDLLFANAGGPAPGNFLDLKPTDWQSAVDLTIHSVVRLMYAVAPAMRARQSGSILVNTSVTVREPLDRLMLSNSLRLAVVGLVKSLANELGPDHIRVNAIAPGWTRTERVDQILAARAKGNDTAVEAEMNKLAATVPLRRMAEPVEFAQAAAFLLSDAASYITGVTLLVDGGMSHAVI